jgi:hypothetical protein
MQKRENIESPVHPACELLEFTQQMVLARSGKVVDGIDEVGARNWWHRNSHSVGVNIQTYDGQRGAENLFIFLVREIELIP